MNYRASFFSWKNRNDFDEKNKNFVFEYDFKGQIEVNDFGTSPTFTLMAKAFRQAPEHLLNCEKVKLERIRD